MKAAVLVFSMIFITAANAREAQLPVPPIPPPRNPTMEAPLPDLNVRVPYADAQRSRVTLDVEINHRTAPAPGLGFARGASYQIDNDRRIALPGIMLRMPFP